MKFFKLISQFHASYTQQYAAKFKTHLLYKSRNVKMYWLWVSLKMPYTLSIIFSLKINPTSVLYNLPYQTLQILRSSDSKIPCLEILTTYLSKNKNNFLKTIILQMTNINFIVCIGVSTTHPPQKH